jgi:hypothetical protein
MADGDNTRLVAEARIARQRELIAHLKAHGEDTSEARAILGAMRYSLRLHRQRQRRARRHGPATRLDG